MTSAPAEPAIGAVDTDVGGPEIAAVTMQAMAVSLQMPSDPAHPNRMPFSGILTRIDEASDRAPNGSGGKRILITRAAAEGALNSLLGMGVGLRRDLTGHNAQNKVGVITAARIDNNAIHIDGFIYASDFPTEALRIHMRQADLGFSFEAQQLRVESVETDPVIVTSCIFTGAAILFKNDAAYKTTAIAAAAAKESTMEDVTAAVTAAVQAALGPMSEQLTTLKAGMDAQAGIIAELQKVPPAMRAVQEAMARVEPHAARLEAGADKLEADGIGADEAAGHAALMRKMAVALRADAARGTLPQTYHVAASRFAPAVVAEPLKIESTPEYQALMAVAAQQAAELKATKEAQEAQATALKDLKAAMDAQRNPPARKTLTPEVNAVLSRMGLQEPGEGGGGYPVHQIDAALDQMKDRLSTTDRIRMKTMLANGGLLQS
jgi:hypothetical protein